MYSIYLLVLSLVSVIAVIGLILRRNKKMAAAIFTAATLANNVKPKAGANFLGRIFRRRELVFPPAATHFAFRPDSGVVISRRKGKIFETGLFRGFKLDEHGFALMLVQTSRREKPIALKPHLVQPFLAIH